MVLLGSQVVTAFATAVLTAYTWYLVKESSLSRKEAARAREEDKRPNIIITIEPHKSYINFLMLVVENIGKGPAYCVETNLSNDLQIGNSHRTNLSESGLMHLPVLKPGQQITSFLGTYPEIKGYASNATTVCKDVDGKECQFGNPLSTETFMGQHRLSDPEHLADIAKALGDMKRAFSGGRLNANLYTTQDREVEEKEHEEWVREMTEKATPNAGN